MKIGIGVLVCIVLSRYSYSTKGSMNAYILEILDDRIEQWIPSLPSTCALFRVSERVQIDNKEVVYVLAILWP